MPDIPAFIKKHTRQTRRSPAAAVTGAASEAYIWAKSNALAPIYDRRERLIWEDDWDVCAVLDATRHDLWAEAAGLRWHDWITEDYAWSTGSCSPEWYTATFDPTVVPDETVSVVTANPFAGKPPDKMGVLDNTPLHENPVVDSTVYAYEESWGCDGGFGYLDVTHPGFVTDRAWEKWQEESPDRLVVHYMQPHLPFRSTPEWHGVRVDLDDFGEPDSDVAPGPYRARDKEVWKELRDGERDRADVWAAYRDNLEWGLEHLERLIDAVDGTFLVTSDHGNGMGERHIWSHPPGVQLEALRKVPWVLANGKGSGRLEEAEYEEASPDERTSLSEKLRALGYK